MVTLNFTVVFKLLLVISIVLQSLSSVASTTSSNHQVDIEHLQTQHQHTSDLESTKGNVDEAGHNIDDCHHCGHCSTSHLSWIFFTYTASKPNIYSLERIPYQSTQTKEYLDTIQRPPIS